MPSTVYMIKKHVVFFNINKYYLIINSIHLTYNNDWREKDEDKNYQKTY